jgi:DNA processing protein
LLRFIKDLPPILFKKGVMPDNNYITVAIVGTRFPSDGGARFAREMAGKLAQRDVVIISGLAQGIDTSAHVGVLNAKGRTLGVLGSGLNMIYPPENVQLALRICRKGAILSECHPDEIVSKGKLIQRNRITSGISQGVILVEPERGAKNTANWASKQKKPVFIYDPENKSA